MENSDNVQVPSSSPYKEQNNTDEVSGSPKNNKNITNNTSSSSSSSSSKSNDSFFPSLKEKYSYKPFNSNLDSQNKNNISRQNLNQYYSPLSSSSSSSSTSTRLDSLSLQNGNSLNSKYNPPNQNYSQSPLSSPFNSNSPLDERTASLAHRLRATHRNIDTNKIIQAINLHGTYEKASAWLSKITPDYLHSNSLLNTGKPISLSDLASNPSNVSPAPVHPSTSSFLARFQLSSSQLNSNQKKVYPPPFHSPQANLSKNYGMFSSHNIYSRPDPKQPPRSSPQIYSSKIEFTKKKSIRDKFGVSKIPSTSYSSNNNKSIIGSSASPSSPSAPRRSLRKRRKLVKRNKTSYSSSEDSDTNVKAASGSDSDVKVTEVLSADESDSDSDKDSSSTSHLPHKSSFSRSQARTLEFINTASADDIADVSGCSHNYASALVSKRPFYSLDDISAVQDPDSAPPPSSVTKPKSRRGGRAKPIGLRVVEDTLTALNGYDAIDSLIKQCDLLGATVADEISSWGVSINGSSGELEVVNVPTKEATATEDEKTSTLKDEVKNIESNGNAVKKENGNSDDDDSAIITNKNQRKSAYTGYFPDQPKSLSISLKDYQQVGINWLSLLYSRKLSCILADEMGLGKTCQVIAFLAHLKECNIPGPHMVIVPASTLENWLREFKRFCPSLVVEPYYGTQNERYDLRQKLWSAKKDKEAEDEEKGLLSDNPWPFDVLVTTYNLAAGSKYDLGFFRSIKFNVCIYDEGHVLKNPNSDRYTKLMNIHAKFRLLLTGTPLQNNLQELVALLSFILPGIFNARHDDLIELFKFKAKTKSQSQPQANGKDCGNNKSESPSDSSSSNTKKEATSTSRDNTPSGQTTMTNEENKNLLSQHRIARAKTMMTPFVLRRRKDQVLSHLPPKVYKVEYCDMVPAQEEIYNKEISLVKERAAQRLEEQKAGKTKASKKAKSKDTSSNSLMQLRKASIHSLLFRKIYDDEKLKIMSKEIMREDRYMNANRDYIFEDMQAMTDMELHKLCCEFPTIRQHALFQQPDDTEEDTSLRKNQAKKKLRGSKEQKENVNLEDLPWMGNKGSGKVKKLEEILKARSADDRFLIFSQFTQILDILESVLSTLKIKFIRLDGSTPVEVRQDMIDSFYSDTSIVVFLLSTKAGGFGINLACANNVIIFDLSFNPHDDRQAEDRAHRVGQTRTVNVIRLVSRGTVEEAILDLANTKLALDKSVSGGDIDGNGNDDIEEEAAKEIENLLIK